MPRVPLAVLAAALEPVFRANGCSDAVAALLAANCAAAERDGAHSHGLFRMPGYVATLRSPGWVDGRAVPAVEDCAPGFVRVDARNGFAVPALAAARDLVAAKARRNGVAVLAIRGSHHLGALSLDVEPFADEGLVAMSFINSMRSVIPHGGRAPVFGTNPVAFAVPRGGGMAPLVIDMATSAMAKGDVQVAAEAGRAVPPGTGVDREGMPTTDAARIVDGGALLPFGGHKGASLTLMVEVLCAALVGGSFSMEMDLAGAGGAVTPRTGQSLVVIDPGCGRGALPGFADRVETLIGFVREAGQDRLPGDRRLEARAESERLGIAVPAATRASLERLGAVFAGA